MTPFLRRALPVAAVSALALSGASVASALPADRMQDELTAASWWYTAMGVPQLHAAGATGRGITVAVIDGPFNATVPELKGRFTATSTCPGVPAQSTDEFAAHGTSMAALIVGSGKGTVDGKGVRGIAPDAKVLGFTFAGERSGVVGCSSKTSLGDAVDAAVKAGAKVISISYGAADDTSAAAVGRAQRAGAIVVAATDDHEKEVGLPAGYNGVLAVNPVDQKARLAAFAAPWKFANDIAVVAPGVLVNRIAPGADGQWRSNASSDGSSPATAVVSGGLAAVWSKYPQASANQVIQLMLATPGVRVGKGTDGKAAFFTAFRRSGSGLPSGDTKTGYGWGVFDPADMVAGDPSRLPDVNPFVATGGKTPSYEDITGTPPPGTSGASPSPSATSSPAGSGQAAEPAGQTSAGGVPAWVWVAVALLVLAAAGGAVAVARGRGGRTDTERGDRDGAGQ